MMCKAHIVLWTIATTGIWHSNKTLAKHHLFQTLFTWHRLTQSHEHMISMSKQARVVGSALKCTSEERA
eukprot:3694171-Amphidinium_carterae.2